MLRFHPQARRAAALAVLRAPDVPSCCYEAGLYLQPGRSPRLASAEGQRGFAEAMARAIRIYFAARSPGRNRLPQPAETGG